MDLSTAENVSDEVIEEVTKTISSQTLELLQNMSSSDFEDILSIVSDNISQGSSCNDKKSKFHCTICQASIMRLDNFKRHMKSHSPDLSKKYQCEICDKHFNRSDNLNNHRKKIHGLLKRKSMTVGAENKNNKSNLNLNVQTGSGNGSENDVPDRVENNNTPNSDIKKKQIFLQKKTSAINDNVQIFPFLPNEVDKVDLLQFFINKREDVLDKLEIELNRKSGVKWYLTVQVNFTKLKPDGEIETSSPYFRCKTHRQLKSENDIDHNLNVSFQQISEAFENYVREGSGWRIKNIVSMELNIATYKPLNGSSYIPCPKRIQSTHACINIQNSDQKCFIWSVLAAKYSISSDQKPRLVKHYLPYEHELRTGDISFPFPITQVKFFERVNNISINVFGFEKEELFPLHITTMKGATFHVNLLYITEGTNSHYILIKDLNRLLRMVKKSSHKHYYCPYCLHGFIREDLLENHIFDCQEFGPQKITMPEEGDNILKFKDWHKCHQIPFCIYADFETFNIPILSAENDPNLSSTEKYQKLEACGFGYQRVCIDNDYYKPPVIYRGANPTKKFLEELLQEAKEIKEILKHEHPVIISEEQEAAFQSAIQCQICNLKFTKRNPKVRHHNHLSGEFLSTVCNNCNLQLKNPSFIPVVIHNLRNFDQNLICESLALFKSEDIQCLPNTIEKYISFSLGPLRFIDSMQFLNSSLDTLVSNLRKDGEDKFELFTKFYSDPDIYQLLLRKGVYPYDYITNESVFSEPVLPQKPAFYNRLTKSSVTDENYQHAETVWERMGIQNLGEYHDLYLTCDVLLLADVFQNFRKIAYKQYGLEALHYFTLPGFSWSACLKMTGVEIELLTDIDAHLMIERGIRGGVSGIFHRYGKANNQYLTPEEQDPESPPSFLSFVDANNLYGWSLSQFTPVSDFSFLTEEEINQFDVTNTTPNDEIGYIIECDLEYPPELHDEHSQFPLAPEQREIDTAELSPYSLRLWNRFKPHKNPEKIKPRPKVKKLVSTLYDKERYIVHVRNLKLYTEFGLRVKNIHRILKFRQSNWLARYILFNTDLRKMATSEAEKDFYKLMNNAIFGKTLEDIRRHVDVKLVQTERKLLKYTSKPNFEYFKIFQNDLVGIQCKRTNIVLNRPCFIGFTVLELAKLRMYDFFYNVIKKNFSKVNLLMSDTDSFFLQIFCDDFYRDLLPFLNELDTSSLPKDHILYSDHNKKVLGKFKFEVNTEIREFVGIRSKMYSFIYGDPNHSENKKVAKGIVKTVIKKDLNHEMYKNCLFNEEERRSKMILIRSYAHELYTITQNKISLSAYDDKRYLLDDGVTSVPYGHWRIASNCTDEYM